MILPFRIGLTGSIATGKSTAIKEILRLGCPVIDADEIARKQYSKSHPSYYLVWLFFGKKVFDKDEVDRKKLSTIIFNNPDKRKLLNMITHPFVILQMILQYLLVCISGTKFVFFDIPLLYESGLDKYMNQTWVIYVNEDLQKKRLISRLRGQKTDIITDLTSSEQQMLLRIEAQISIERKKLLANIVVNNSESVDQLNERIRYLIESLRNEIK